MKNSVRFEGIIQKAEFEERQRHGNATLGSLWLVVKDSSKDGLTHSYPIPLTVSNPFEARLITSELAGQQIDYSTSSSAGLTSHHLTVKSGRFAGIEYICQI